ncbi:MAG: hypothetical protein ACOCV4_03005 [Myxococcota bacterium]
MSWWKWTLGFSCALLAAGCAESHSVDRAPTEDAGSDARVTACGDEPEAPECRALCMEVCEGLEACGVDPSRCLADCYDALACPGETPDHDAAICSGLSPPSDTCEDLCALAADWGGYGAGAGTTCP